MLTKEKVQEIINHMPDVFQADDLIERIILLQKIEIGRQQIKDGNSFSEEEIDNMIDSWQ